MAFSFIWRTRSLVRPKYSPISSSVISCVPIPKKYFTISLSLSVRVESARSISLLSDSFTRPRSAFGESLFTSTSKRLLSSPSTKGASTETCLHDTLRVSAIFSLGISRISASSSGEGILSFSCSNFERALFILFSEPTWLSGSLTILDCSASACRMD